jgi:molybdopterin/thiamine biosynthesis adenylyltransferase
MRVMGRFGETRNPQAGYEETIGRVDVAHLVETTGRSLHNVEIDCLNRNIIPLKYAKTVKALGIQNLITMRRAKVMVLGCGGVGDYVCECLMRIGIGQLTIVDGDVFEESNLNRQLYCYEDNLGLPKVDETVKILRRINAASVVIPIHKYINEGNCVDIIQSADLVVDALDRFDDRFAIASSCSKLRIPYVFGNIGSDSFRIAVQEVGDSLFERLYSKSNITDSKEGTPVISAAFCGVAMAAEAVKYLCHMDDVLINQMLHVCWRNLDSTRIDLSALEHKSKTKK